MSAWMYPGQTASGMCVVLVRGQNCSIPADFCGVQAEPVIDTGKRRALGYPLLYIISPLPPHARAVVAGNRESAPKQGE
jgi:hypothetical protein